MFSLHENLWPGELPPDPRGAILRGRPPGIGPSPEAGPGAGRAGAAARAHRVPALVGDAEQPGVQPVGERVLRRLEAALEPPSR